MQKVNRAEAQKLASATCSRLCCQKNGGSGEPSDVVAVRNWHAVKKMIAPIPATTPTARESSSKRTCWRLPCLVIHAKIHSLRRPTRPCPIRLHDCSRESRIQINCG